MSPPNQEKEKNSSSSSTNTPNETTSNLSTASKNLDKNKKEEEDPNCGTCTDFKTWMDSNRQNYYYPNNSYYSSYYSQQPSSNGQTYSGQGYQTQSSYTNLYPSYSSQSSSGYQQSQSTTHIPTTTTVTTTTRSSSSQPREPQQTYSSSYSSSQPAKSSSTTSNSSAYDYDECPLFRDQLGRAAWTYLHQMAAHYPQNPSEDEKQSMRSFIYAFARFFPCRTCSRDFSDLIRKYPPKVESQQELTRYFCDQHNNVNAKLGKPQFDCDKVNQRWKHSESKNPACNPNASRS